MMKKIAFVLAMVMISGLLFTSCRKCVTCKAYDRSTNMTVVTQEYCGPKRVIEDDEDYFESLWNDAYYYAECK